MVQLYTDKLTGATTDKPTTQDARTGTIIYNTPQTIGHQAAAAGVKADYNAALLAGSPQQMREAQYRVGEMTGRSIGGQSQNLAPGDNRPMGLYDGTMTVSSPSGNVKSITRSQSIQDVAAGRSPERIPVKTFAEISLEQAKLRPGYTPEAQNIDPIALEYLRQQYEREGRTRQEGQAQNLLQQWGQNKVEVASEYHYLGKRSGVAVPANPYEYAGDLAVEFLKGKPQRSSEMFSPVSGEISRFLPGGGYGLQQMYWDKALNNDNPGKYSPVTTGLSFIPAIMHLQGAEKSYGPYGSLFGGDRYVGTPSSDGLRKQLDFVFTREARANVDAAIALSAAERGEASAPPMFREPTATATGEVIQQPMVEMVKGPDGAMYPDYMVPWGNVSAKPDRLVGSKMVAAVPVIIEGAHSAELNSIKKCNKNFENAAAAATGGIVAPAAVAVSEAPPGKLIGVGKSPQAALENLGKPSSPSLLIGKSTTTKSKPQFFGMEIPFLDSITTFEEQIRSKLPSVEKGEQAFKESQRLSLTTGPYVVAPALAMTAAERVVGSDNKALQVIKEQKIGDSIYAIAPGSMAGQYTTFYEHPAGAAAAAALGGMFGFGGKVASKAYSGAVGITGGRIAASGRVGAAAAGTVDFAARNLPKALGILYGADVAYRSTEGLTNPNPIAAMTRAKSIAVQEAAPMGAGFVVGYEGPGFAYRTAKGAVPAITQAMAGQPGKTTEIMQPLGNKVSKPFDIAERKMMEVYGTTEPRSIQNVVKQQVQYQTLSSRTRSPLKIDEFREPSLTSSERAKILSGLQKNKPNLDAARRLISGVPKAKMDIGEAALRFGAAGDSRKPAAVGSAFKVVESAPSWDSTFRTASTPVKRGVPVTEPRSQLQPEPIAASRPALKYKEPVDVNKLNRLLQRKELNIKTEGEMKAGLSSYSQLIAAGYDWNAARSMFSGGVRGQSTTYTRTRSYTSVPSALEQEAAAERSLLSTEPKTKRKPIFSTAPMGKTAGETALSYKVSVLPVPLPSSSPSTSTAPATRNIYKTQERTSAKTRDNITPIDIRFIRTDKTTDIPKLPFDLGTGSPSWGGFRKNSRAYVETLGFEMSRIRNNPFAGKPKPIKKKKGKWKP